MANTPKLLWPYPDRDVDPWYDSFQSMVEAQDASVYSSREDRHAIMGGTGKVSFNSGTGVLASDSNIYIYSPITGYRFTLLPFSTTILSGQIIYVNLVRSPITSLNLTVLVSNSAPNSDGAFTLAIRQDGDVYFRNGSRVSNGDDKNIFDTGTAPLDASDTVKGITKLSVAPAVASNPIAIGDNDPRFDGMITISAADITAGSARVSIIPTDATVTTVVKALWTVSVDSGNTADPGAPPAGSNGYAVITVTVAGSDTMAREAYLDIEFDV
jgi:hypothetical protein